MVGTPTVHNDGRSYSPLDPREDTERSGPQESGQGGDGVTAHSIRERILKEKPWFREFFLHGKSYSPLDPREDTERSLRA